MAYIGNNIQTQGFTPAVDYFSGNGSTVTFTLSRPVAAAVQVEAVIDNVVQNPSTAYTVSGNAITFTSAPLSGSNNIYVRYTSLITTYNGISQSPSVIGDLTASGGYLSTGSFNNSFLDGTIVDYVTGNGRLTVGAADGFTIYNGGTSARSALMTLDSSGNMGIGTASPADIVDVTRSTSSNSNGGLTLTNTSNSGYGSALSWNMKLNSTAGNWGRINVETASSTATFMRFFTTVGSSLTEQMRIDLNGSLLVGTTSLYGGEKLAVLQSTNNRGVVLQQTNASNTSVPFNIDCSRNTTNSTYAVIQYFNSGAGLVRFVVQDSGNVQNTNNSYGAVSDIKLKENIVDASPKLEDLCKVKIRQYNLKSDPTHKQIGVVAQELEEVFAGMVEESPDRDADGNDLGTTTKAVKYSVFVPMLIKAIQELKAEVDALKAGK